MGSHLGREVPGDRVLGGVRVVFDASVAEEHRHALRWFIQRAAEIRLPVSSYVNLHGTFVIEAAGPDEVRVTFSPRNAP